MIEIPPLKPASELRVLVIDDQALVHDIVKNALLDVGIEKVSFAENAYYALRLCEKHSYDIVLIAFNVKSDKDGFHLLEEMKFKRYVNKETSVVFLSADTDASLVNCVVELQPDDFWVKPLDRHKVETRLKHLINVRKKLYKLNYCCDQEEYSTAIYYAERQLLDTSLSQYHPHIHKLIAESLFALLEFSEAESYYLKLAENYKFGWVQIGLLKTLLKQDKLDEATKLVSELVERDDTRFPTYDALAQFYIEHEEYEKAYEEIQKATKLAPRNIERNKRSCDLARLNHDRLGQYNAMQNMAKYAKNSIHDSPELTLNVIRAALDLAGTLPANEANVLVKRTERDINHLQNLSNAPRDMTEQLAIIKVRTLCVQNSKKQAEEILKPILNTKISSSVDDNLDKVKAYHELGYREESLKIIEGIKDQIAGNSFASQVLAEYIHQEQTERENIHFTPKELTEMAATYYKQKRMPSAFNNLSQALQLTPHSVPIALSLVKVLVKLKEEQGLEESQVSIGKQCVKLLNGTKLSSVQKASYAEYLAALPDIQIEADEEIEPLQQASSSKDVQTSDAMDA